jgi:SpoVK/Ycf46/Vps4 family AAA+-type ATPase
MTGTILTYMQDREADGAVFIGLPGAAKSAAAKATGGTAGIPTIAFDLPAMESSLVGASTELMRILRIHVRVRALYPARIRLPR